MTRNIPTGRASGHRSSRRASAARRVKFDPTKPWGPAQQAPLTPEYQKVLRGQHGRPGQGRARQLPDRPLPAGRHAAHDVVRGAGIRHHAGDHLYPARRRRRPHAPHLHRRTRLARRTSSRPIRAIRSANGSTRTATAATTCSRSRRAARSRDRAPTTRPGCRCTSTISRSSRSGSISTRPIRTFCMTRSP